MLGNYRVAEQLMASRVEFSSKEVIIIILTSLLRMFYTDVSILSVEFTLYA
jgi:hypothetical protein